VTERYLADAVVTCNRDFGIHRPGVVDIDGGRVAWVGPPEGAPSLAPEREHRLSGVLMPGLVNIHCHSPMTLFRGAAEDIPLDSFLRDVLWPREARLTDEDVYWGMLLAAVEMLTRGVTTCCEMYIFELGMLDAVLESGIRSVITPGVMLVPGWTHFASWEERLEAVVAFYDQHAGRNDRAQIGMAAHSAYALPLEALRGIAEAACARDALLHIHVAETREEGAELEQRHGKSVPALLADIGFFDARVLAAHSVWLTDEDLETYSAHDVAVAHCPQSNAKLAAGIARLNDLLEAGVRLGLGTDGPASNNNLDLWEEIQLCGLLARLRTSRPDALSARRALELATRGGAEALGRDDIGALEPRRWADMVLLRADDAAFVPLVEERDLVSHMAWAASSRLVTDVWVAGRRVVADGRCLMVEEGTARREVQERGRRLASET
jgi:5-methylthioadenosine/S-adenosylhomocysteine deaminase